MKLDVLALQSFALRGLIGFASRRLSSLLRAILCYKVMETLSQSQGDGVVNSYFTRISKSSEISNDVRKSDLRTCLTLREESISENSTFGKAPQGYFHSVSLTSSTTKCGRCKERKQRRNLSIVIARLATQAVAISPLFFSHCYGIVRL